MSSEFTQLHYAVVLRLHNLAAKAKLVFYFGLANDTLYSIPVHAESSIVSSQYCPRPIAVQRFECDEQTNGQTYNVISRKTERTHGAVANRVL